jgi:hypothetical protein
MEQPDGQARHQPARGARAVRTIFAAVGLLAIATVTACGSSSSSSSTTAESANYQQALAYSQCMRSHGVSDFPDPSSNGSFFQMKSTAVDSVQLQSAEQACRSLLPNGGQMPQSQQLQDLDKLLKFAECIRAHGEPTFPDPTSASGGVGGLIQRSGINPSSSQLLAAERACQSEAPGSVGGS